jgi:hypothetical protein
MRRVKTWTSMGGTAVAIDKRDYRLMLAVVRAAGVMGACDRCREYNGHTKRLILALDAFNAGAKRK